MPSSLLIINPVSGKGRGERLKHKLIQQCKQIFPEAHTIITKYPQHARELIEKEGSMYDHIFVAGGDGTLNEIVNGKSAEHDFRLTVLPIGSGNDFARMTKLLGMKYGPIFQASKDTKPEHIDIAELKIRNKSNQTITRRFHSSCGSGFDAFVSKISNRKSVLRGLPLYMSSVFKAIFIYRSMDVDIAIDNHRISGKKLLITCGNTKTSGGGFNLTPKAKLDDGLLDFMIGNDLKKLQILSLLPKAVFGNHLTDRRVSYFQAPGCKVRFKEPSIIHADGEIICEESLELDIRIIPKFLKVTRL